MSPVSQPSRFRRTLRVAVLPALGALSGIGIVVARGFGSGWSTTFSVTALSFALFVAVTDQLEIPLERGRSFALGLAPGLGFALLRTCPGASASCKAPMIASLGEVVAVFLVGSVAGLALRIVRGRELRIANSMYRVAVVATAAATYHAALSATGGHFTFGPARMSAPGLAAVLVEVVGLELLIGALLSVDGENLPLLQTLRGQMRTTTPLVLSTVSVAALLALSYPALGGWTLPLFVVPLAATDYSFRQVATIRGNYLQTVRALSKVPEMAGYTVKGHSTRVARLAVAIAKELGTGDSDLHEIEYGALLHDIGRVSLPDPEETPAGVSRLELALVGAEIVEKTGHFPRVASMVRQQNEPYRRRGEDSNRTLTLGAKIIKVASAYDDMTEPTGPGRSPWDALERLHTGMAYDYDPHVIQALTRVLERNGLI